MKVIKSLFMALAICTLSFSIINCGGGGGEDDVDDVVPVPDVVTTSDSIAKISNPIPLPGTDFVGGVAWDGTNLWILNGDGITSGTSIYKVDSSNGSKVGEEIKLTCHYCSPAYHLEWDNENFWTGLSESSTAHAAKLSIDGSEALLSTPLYNDPIHKSYTDYSNILIDGGLLGIFDNYTILKFDFDGNYKASETITDPMNIVTGYNVTAAASCGEAYWLVAGGGSIYRASKPARAVDAELEIGDTANLQITDMACDSANKILWIVGSFNGSPVLYKAELK